MCRRPCCDHSDGQGAGIGAVAVVIVAALVTAKIGPVVARIIHVVVEVLRLVALTTGLVVALAAVTWAAIMITRWQLRRKALAVHRTRVIGAPSIWVSEGQGRRPAECLACGGTGTVLLAISDGRYQPGACLVCEPITRPA